MVTKKLVLANRPFSRASFQYLLSLTTSRSLLATRCLSSDAIQVPTAGFRQKRLIWRGADNRRVHACTHTPSRPPEARLRPAPTPPNSK